MKLKLIKEVEILSCCFKIEYDKKSDGGSFSWANAKIVIGIKSIKSDPLYTFSVISHEIMEVIFVSMGLRYDNKRTMDNYLFNFSHIDFETAINIHAQALSKFIDWKK